MKRPEVTSSDNMLSHGRFAEAEKLLREKTLVLRWSLDNLKTKDLWTLDKRLKWLRILEKKLMELESEILKAVSTDKGRSEFSVLITEFAPVLSLVRDYLRTAKRTLRPQNRTRILSLNWGNKKIVVHNEPRGIVGIISPGNYPFSLSIGPVISAILAGNAAILKPAPGNPKTNNLVNEILVDSLILAGLFRTLPGDVEGPDIVFLLLPENIEYGKALVASKGVDKIHFTGSVKAGLEVLRVSAETRLTPPTLELGGSNAAIVLKDADITEAARVIVFSRFVAMSCNNIKRVFAVREIYDELCQEIRRATLYLHPHEISETFSEAERQNYDDFLTECGNYHEVVLRVKKFRGSQYPNALKPALVEIPFPGEVGSLKILTEETFVPILPVVRVKDEVEAVRLTNNSQFGLGVSVFTRNKKIFRELSKTLDCGGVYHNDALTEFAVPGVPFGGRKNSGHGFSHGPEGLLEFVEKKPVITEGWKVPKLHLFPWTETKMKWLGRLLKFIIRFS